MKTRRTLTTAQLLGALPSVSKDSIRRWAREGLLPYDITPGGHRRFDLDEVLEALSPAPRTHLVPLAIGPGKVHVGPGTNSAPSQADELAGRLRAVVTSVGAVEGDGARVPSRAPAAPVRTPLAELVGSARRVLVGTPA
jgi:hypothetical protein